MKILTVLGTRPEIIRLSRLVPKLDRASQHLLVWTGQNFDALLSKTFFEEFGLHAPDYDLGARGSSMADQVGQILTGCERILTQERPDRLLILGDTNSGLSAFVAKRLGIPVFHMEAGNRCRDPRVPEEVNRRVIDHCSDVLMPYTESSRGNLLQEGFARERIYVTGNPIFEVLNAHEREIEASPVLNRLGLTARGYFLVTMHRAENVDLPERLQSLSTALTRLAERHSLPVIVSTHPRTRARLSEQGIATGADVRFLDPFGFFDFVALEKGARCILSDSGTVQEEASILRIPNVTLRDVTERPETIECGSNILAGADPDRILGAVDLAMDSIPGWSAPDGYEAAQVSDTVLRILLGYHHGLPRP